MTRPALIFLRDGLGPAQHVILHRVHGGRVEKDAPGGRVNIDLAGVVIGPEGKARHRLAAIRIGSGEEFSVLVQVDPSNRHRKLVLGERIRRRGPAGGIVGESFHEARLGRIHDWIHLPALELHRPIQIDEFNRPVIPIARHLLGQDTGAARVVGPVLHHRIGGIQLVGRLPGHSAKMCG